MLDVLARLERELPELLVDATWHSLHIDYHPPVVERLWIPWGDHRVSLHRIFPCAAGDALFHPHPWPSAMRILDGRYEMAIGHGRGATPPPAAARLIAGAELTYEMTDPDAWHYVRPLDGPARTVMVTGKPWPRRADAGAPSHPPLQPLDPAIADELLAWFSGRYPRANR